MPPVDGLQEDTPVSENLLNRLLEQHGFELVRQRKHRVFRNPAGQIFILPSTPSDKRWSANALADLARLCGPVEEESRPLRARRLHGRLEAMEPTAPLSVEVSQAPKTQPAAEPLPALSRADQLRLKRWEKHEKQRKQRDPKSERRLAKLRDLAFRAHGSLEKWSGGDPSSLIVALTEETLGRIKRLGFQDTALSVADVVESVAGARSVALYVRVGSRFVDILCGVVREGPTWQDDDATVEVWGDLACPDDAEQLEGKNMYFGPAYVNPSQFRLDLRIPGGVTLELALFQALLSYAEGMPALVFLNDYLVHGRETVQQAQAAGSTVRAKIIRLQSDNTKELHRAFNAFNADDCDWPELLEAVRRNFTAGSLASKSYVAWLKHEIAKRIGDG